MSWVSAVTYPPKLLPLSPHPTSTCLLEHLPWGAFRVNWITPTTILERQRCWQFLNFVLRRWPSTKCCLDTCFTPGMSKGSFASKSGSFPQNSHRRELLTGCLIVNTFMAVFAHRMNLSEVTSRSFSDQKNGYSLWIYKLPFNYHFTLNFASFRILVLLTVSLVLHELRSRNNFLRSRVRTRKFWTNIGCTDLLTVKIIAQTFFVFFLSFSVWVSNKRAKLFTLNSSHW